MRSEAFDQGLAILSEEEHPAPLGTSGRQLCLKAELLGYA
jgi:hypothetical protein